MKQNKDMDTNSKNCFAVGQRVPNANAIINSMDNRQRFPPINEHQKQNNGSFLDRNQREIIWKYENTHTIRVAGYFNASFVRQFKDPQDDLFKSFCIDMGGCCPCLLVDVLSILLSLSFGGCVVCTFDTFFWWMCCLYF